ncbi:MAG: hypothetical protein PHH10_04980, partial [Dysgonamonadaceae bacterium]|nr:hypothetical protein [Dysgonamonadaceae bacterium]
IPAVALYKCSVTLFLHPVNLSLTDTVSLVPVLSGIEFVTHRQFQFARIPAAKLVNIETVVTLHSVTTYMSFFQCLSEELSL